MTERRSFLRALAALPAAAVVASAGEVEAAPAPTPRDIPRVRNGLGFLMLEGKFTKKSEQPHFAMDPAPDPELDDLVRRFREGVLDITRTPDIYYPMEVNVLRADGSEWGGHILRPVPEGAGLAGLSRQHKEVPYRLDPVRIFRGRWEDFRHVVRGRERYDQNLQMQEAVEARDLAGMRGPRPTRLDRREISVIQVSFRYIP